MPPLPPREENLNLTLRNHSEIADDDGAMQFANDHRISADENGAEMFDRLSKEAAN